MLAGRQARGRLGSSARRAIPLADAAAAPARFATAHSGSMDERDFDSARSNVDGEDRDLHQRRERGIAHESFSFVADRRAFGVFAFSQTILDMVPQYRRAYTLQIIARNTPGNTEERFVPIVIR